MANCNNVLEQDIKKKNLKKEKPVKKEKTVKKELTYRIFVSTAGLSDNNDDFKNWDDFPEKEKKVIREKIGTRFFESLGYKNVRAI